MFGDHEATSTAWPLVSYLNSMVSFYRYLFRRLLCSLSEIKALYAATRFAVGLADRLLAVFFRSAGFYTAISCQPKDKLTDISVDCVVSIPYRSVRKKKERNKKYYACNSEQLRKKHAGLLLNSIKHAKSSQLEAKSDFGKGCHTRSTEPYFYEAAYLYVRDSLSL